eukprot:7376245-Prymnesium_polylepis.1
MLNGSDARIGPSHSTGEPVFGCSWSESLMTGDCGRGRGLVPSRAAGSKGKRRAGATGGERGWLMDD